MFYIKSDVELCFCNSNLKSIYKGPLCMTYSKVVDAEIACAIKRENPSLQYLIKEFRN